MKHSLIFHIGLEKTGTTSFQQFCSDQTHIMQDLGVYYPKHDYSFYGNNHSPFSASYLNKSVRSFVSYDSLVSRYIAMSKLKYDIEIGQYDKILISSEHFSSRFSELEVEQLACDFSHYQPKIIVVVRDHYSLVRAAYSTAILSGSRFTMAEFIDMLWDPKIMQPLFQDVYFRFCRYREIIGSWERFFGKENVRVLKYQGDKTSIEVILSEILERQVSLSTSFQYSLNRTIAPHLIEYVRLFNMVMPSWEELFNAGALNLWPYVCEKRANFLSLVSEIAWPDIPGGIQPISEGCRSKLAQLAAADQEWLSEHGIQFISELPTDTTRDVTSGKMSANRHTSSPTFVDFLTIISSFDSLNVPYSIIFHTLQQAAEDKQQALQQAAEDK